MLPQFSFEADGGLTVADLAAAGVLRELGDRFQHLDAARGFLIGFGFTAGQIEEFRSAEIFWRFHADKISQGITPGGLAAFARYVFAAFPSIGEHAARRGLVLPPAPPVPEPAGPFDVLLPITTGLAAGNLQLEAVVTAARRALRSEGHASRVIDPVGLVGLPDPAPAGQLAGHVKRLDPAAFLIVGKPDARLHSALTALPHGLLKNRLVITHGVFTPDELRVCGAISGGALAANSLYPDELDRFVFEATHKLLREGATLRETLNACREKLHGVGQATRSSESLQGLLTLATPEGRSPDVIRARSSRIRPA